MMFDNSESIGVRVEVGTSNAGNAVPVLHEILHALRRLAETSHRTIIDLRAIPFGPGDEERLLETLGAGEVTARVDSLGHTHISETRFPGVWLVDYRDASEARIGLQVEVTDVPGLLRTPHDDLNDAVDALEKALAAAVQDPSQSQEPTL